MSSAELELRQTAFDWARSGDVSRLSAFLSSGRPANLTNDRGDTLLILAAYHVQRTAVELLLAYGADVDRVNDNGQTALGAAVFRRSSDCVSTLLAAGAGADVGPRSALDVARFFHLDDMLPLLVDQSSGTDAGPSGSDGERVDVVS